MPPGASGTGVIEAGTNEKKFVIGVDSDQSLTATERAAALHSHQYAQTLGCGYL